MSFLFLPFISFYGQSALLLTVRGSSGFFLGVGVLLRGGGIVNVQFWASLYLPFFSVGRFFGTFQVYTSVDGKGSFGWIQTKYGIDRCW